MVFVTGATGFIGAAVVRQLLAQGLSVCGLVRSSTIAHRNFDDVERKNDLHLIEGCLEELPVAEIEKFSISACVHTAWVTEPGVYLDSPLNKSFLESSKGLGDWVVSAGIPYVLGIGTCVEYAPSVQPLNEANSHVTPKSAYARAKVAIYQHWRKQFSAAGVKFCWGRVFYPYGPKEPRQKLCSYLIEKLVAGETIELKTPRSKKDYIYIDDLAAAVGIIVESYTEGIVNIGTGEGISVKNLALKAADSVGKSGALVECAEEAFNDPNPFVVADIGRLKALGWQPTVDLREGLYRELQYLRKAGVFVAANQTD